MVPLGIFYSIIDIIIYLMLFCQSFLHWIISPLRPRITTKYSPNSLPKSDDDSFFLERFDHIITTARDMLTVGWLIECLCPYRMIWREISLIFSHQENENFLYHFWVSSFTSLVFLFRVRESLGYLGWCRHHRVFVYIFIDFPMTPLFVEWHFVSERVIHSIFHFQ